MPAIRGWRAILLAWLVLGCQFAWAQKVSNWRVYRMIDGLAEPACASVTVGPHGKVLTRHVTKPSITLLDGYSVTRLPAPDTPAQRAYQSPAGQLWAAGPSGLLELRDESWVPHFLPEFAARQRDAGFQLPILPVRQGLVLYLVPEALMAYYAREQNQVRTEPLRAAADTRVGQFKTMSLARDGGLWIAGSGGLVKVSGPVRNLRTDSPWVEYLPPDHLRLSNFDEPRDYEDGAVTSLANSAAGEKVIVYMDRQRWTVESPKFEGLKMGWRSPNKVFWGVTQTSLFQWEQGASEVTENEEISARKYYDAQVERGSIFWLATSDGLFRHAPPAWRTPKALSHIASVIHCLGGDSSDRLWFVSANALHSNQGDSYDSYNLPTNMWRRPPQALYSLRNGGVLLQSLQTVALFDPQGARFAPLGDEDTEMRLVGTVREGVALIQARGLEGTNAPFVFRTFDGLEWADLPNPPQHPAFDAEHASSVLAVQNGDLWLGFESGVAWRADGVWHYFAPEQDIAPESAVGFVELGDGRVWSAAQDRVWEFDGRAWRELPRGFDRINSIVRTRDGSVWVASNTGCQRFSQGTWVDNGVEEGLPSAGIRAIFEDSRGRVWAGTSQGVATYHPEADPDPPRSFIHELEESQLEIVEGGSVTLTFGGVDKWKFTGADRLLHSYRLDQKDWSEFSDQTRMTFSELAAGKHYFQVRTMDRNCNIDPRPARVEFLVVLPWYKETRLVSIGFAGAAVALFFAALAFNRHRRLLRSYAEVERKVAQRTRELEAANRELLHSQKMTALGTLAAGIAHDFNNILSIVKGSAQIIESNLHDASKVRIRVDRIKTVVEQGAGIVTAMLGFSRDSGQQSGFCQVNSVVDDTVKLLGDRFLREVKIQLRPASDLPEVWTAKDLVQQVLLNFIFNAAESMSGRKEVIIATRLLEQLPDESVLLPTRAKDYLEISVQDFGSGIAPDVLPRIFEPFFTTKAFSTRRGTGLGLSMVYELARKIGAGLAVRTVLNQGTTFSVILPVVEGPPPEQPANEPDEKTDYPGPGRR